MTSRIIFFLLLATNFAAAAGAPAVRICVGPVENHSKYELPLEKLRGYLVSQLSHKQTSAVAISGPDLAAAMAEHHCDYLLTGEFSNFAGALSPTCPQCPAIDERKHFALQFHWTLAKSVAGEPVLAHKSTVVDKNPKTCADDHVWETVQLIRDHLKRGSTAGANPVLPK